MSKQATTTILCSNYFSLIITTQTEMLTALQNEMLCFELDLLFIFIVFISYMI